MVLSEKVMFLADFEEDAEPFGFFSLPYILSDLGVGV
jgi:hypothetical protein